MVVKAGALRFLPEARVLVMGDLILDTYTIGNARRISPEAPVAIVKVHDEFERPGGAGNVAINIAALGAYVRLVGRHGDDENGAHLCETLHDSGVSTEELIVQTGQPTTKKSRIIADNQQIVRVDSEERCPLSKELEEKLIQDLPRLLDGITVVALSDYAQGFFSRNLLQAIIKNSRKKGIPVVVDPKGLDYSRYKGATIVKPNLGEAREASTLPNDTSLDQVAEVLLDMTQSDALLITCGKDGMRLYDRKKSLYQIPTRAREVMDVTGAGDTVLSVLSCAIGGGLSFRDGSQLANIAAGIAIERLGCAMITLSDLSRGLLNLASRNKLIDKAHWDTLEEALKEEALAILTIEGEEVFDLDVYSKIRAFKKENPDKTLLVCLHQIESDSPLIDLLDSLNEVEFIVCGAEIEKMIPRALTKVTI